MAQKTPIEPSVIARAVAGVRYALTGKKPEWFGPGQPIEPVAQAPAQEGGAKGRQFDFPVAININRSPRDEGTQSGISFAHLRALADGYDLMRLAIETRKDQIAKLKWSFGPTDEKKQADSRCQELVDFFKFPDKENDWDTWLRALLEDMLVIDAPTIYPRPTLAGDVYAFELIDGATIKRILDPAGRTPLPPDPAYQQILKGMPAVDYSRDELIYKPRNVRTNRIYGYSPVEQVLMTVNIALRRQVHQLAYYTEGNIPDALIGVPPEWSPETIKQFQEYWDMLHEGDSAQKRHAKFVPGGMAYNPTRDPKLKDEFDDWLARIICYAFGVSPQQLVKEMNRATAESGMKQALAEGLMPMMNWVRNLINQLIWKYFGYTDIEFKWQEEDEQSPKEQADTIGVLVDKKVITPDEARERLGMDPLTPEQKEELNPPPPPGLGVDPATGQPKAPTVGQTAPPGATPPPPDPKAASAGGASLGKALAAPLRKSSVSPISRKRPAKVQAEGALHQTVKEFLSKRASIATDALRGGPALAKAKKPTKKDVERVLKELDIDFSDLAPELVPILKDLIKEAGEIALEQVLNQSTDDMLSQVNEFAVDYAETRAAVLVKGLEESTEDMLRSTVIESIEEGWSNQALADKLADSYGFSDERAMTIARTETAIADVQGNLEGWRASGVVAGKRWITDPNEPCDDCGNLGGEEVPLDEDFPDGGGDGPPLHPNCECDVVPIINED